MDEDVPLNHLKMAIPIPSPVAPPPLGLASFPIGLCKPCGTTQQTLEKAKTQTQDSIKRKEVGQRSEET